MAGQSVKGYGNILAVQVNFKGVRLKGKGILHVDAFILIVGSLPKLLGVGSPC